MLHLIPISDANPTRRFPFVTIALIVVNIVLFFQEPGLGSGRGATVYFYNHAPVPCQLVDECPAGLLPGPESVSLVAFLASLLFSTFLHAGFLHIAGNMLFLWIFGNNIEDHLGRVKYLAFYLLGGLVAGLAHVLWSLRDIGGATSALNECIASAAQCSPPSAFVPAVGASGAVAAVMGAYLWLFPRARVNVLVPIFILWTVVQMSAWAVLGLWFVFQFLTAAQELSGAVEVAWMAHVGGFIFGLVAILLLGGRPDPPVPVWQPDRRY
ncbi:MAG: rhomboid family intramembrane serine protease [Actinomycetota bacterium]